MARITTLTEDDGAAVMRRVIGDAAGGGGPTVLAEVHGRITGKRCPAG